MPMITSSQKTKQKKKTEEKKTTQSSMKIQPSPRGLNPHLRGEPRTMTSGQLHSVTIDLEFPQLWPGL